MANSKIVATKEQKVNELVEVLKNCKSFLFFEYLGLNAKQSEQLRRDLHNGDAKMYVMKNNIFNRALAAAGITGLEEIAGPCALVVSKTDEVLPFKEINKLMKDCKFIHYKTGYLEGNVIGVDKLSTLANLPSKNDLLSMLCSVLQGSIRNLAYGLKAVADSKQS